MTLHSAAAAQTFSGSESCTSIISEFDRLAPGESVLVVGAGDPRALLTRLQTERKGLFEWSPLEMDPECFKVEIARRAASPGALREVEEALAWDHDRLDALEQKTFDLAGRGAIEAAREAWAHFAAGLKRHIRFEERILFPTFEVRLGVPAEGGPTAVMRDEHRAIECLLDTIGSALASGSVPYDSRERFRALLFQHNLKEERVLYPSTDRCLDPAERDRLVAQIQAS